MTIRQKLYLLGIVATLGVLALLLSTNHLARTTSQLNQARTLVSQAEIRLLNMRRNEKDFLLRNQDPKFAEEFRQNGQVFTETEQSLSAILLNLSIPASTTLREGANKSCNLGLDQAFTLPA